MEELKSTIIINADDYGYNTNINSAIVYCLRNNLINSTTIMVTMEGFEEAIEMANKYDLKKKIGVHLNLTQGQSMTDLSNTGLTDENGHFIRSSISSPYIRFSPELKRKIRNEIQQQYNKVIRAGLFPTHIDSHHSIHVTPGVADLFIDLAIKEKQKIRITNSGFRKNPFQWAFAVYLNKKYKKHQINFTERFAKVSSFLKHYDKVRDEKVTYEIMVHPAYAGDRLIDTVDNDNLEESLLNIRKLYS